ncbi:hypothetical protein IOD16_10145 [Saccharothrix sp. 6-C]|uniref:hypothetical protein n=1 Tax=Saccharothrix sp. 6-C TaxID=2781735 RepID=UPI0019174A44|nr:hypothetical protein [Saccharothrix sp. 6-C]QQQ78766.1 hypothetical protein IOD16_10145 [Saccharothrix sp. 6-C]
MPSKVNPTARGRRCPVANSGGPLVDESAIRVDSGLVDLTNVPLDALDTFDDEILMASTDRFLRQVDHASGSVGGHS